MYRDYTGKAVLTLFLYCLGYVPGLIANLVWLVLAIGDRDRYGEAPGLGCLVVLLILFIGGPIAVYIGLQHLY